ncbi:MAG: alpha/beta fold hydrolase [Hasllibacter sp.]
MIFHAPDGAALHYEDAGEGPPVLALPGLTRCGSDFDWAAPHLRHVRLIRLDPRGRGRSDRTGPDTYTIPQEAADAVALLDHLGIGRAAILGTSRGGLLAMWIAAHSPGRLSGVCLNDIGPEIAGPGLGSILTYLGRRPAARTLGAQAEARAAFAAGAGFEDVPMTRWRDEVARHHVQLPDGLALNYDPALREAVEAAGAQPAPDLWPFFDALPDPLCAIRGANSDLLSPATFAAMRDRRPAMIAAEVPGRGHVPFLDEPAALAALTEWTARL